MSTKPTFYTAFANSEKNFIPNLSEEAMKISDLMQDLAFNDKLYYIKDEVFNMDRLVKNFLKYGNRFDIFYFSGHGGDGCLRLIDDFKIQPEDMADIVKSSLKNVKLLFLNACETFDLAQAIVKQRAATDNKLVLISCRNEINSIISERFATLFFSQIGQPGTYRDAYDQAKNLTKLTSRTIRFQEFTDASTVQNADSNFDIGYIEIGSDDVNPPDDGANKKEKDTPAAGAAATAPTSPKSIIGNDKLTLDALTTNYLREVVNSISKAPDFDKATVELLSNALQAADQVAKGQKTNKEVSQLFNQAAEKLPGISSGSTFNSLVNAEKHHNDPSVQGLIKHSDSPINSMIDSVNNIKI